MPVASGMLAVDASFAEFPTASSVPFEVSVLLAFPAALPGFADTNVAPVLGAAVVALSGAACGCESMPPGPGACGSNMEGVMGRGAATALDVSLKLMLNALSPQSISPPVRMDDKLLEGVELQLPLGI